MNKANIDELRNLFIDDVESKGQDAVHPKDLLRVQNDDFWLHRFLLHNEQNVQNALGMLWESVTWRKQFQVNDVNDLVKVDILEQGGFFPFGKDQDGSTLFVFKCKMYVKGVYQPDDLKRCVVYWFERMEREGKGNPITIFFDMEGCGLANFDLDFVKYLIGLFKQYYPFFLNYILIFEMPWILNAAFKIIKGILPEKAVEKIKFINKKNIREFIPEENILSCWGGPNDYSFSYVLENRDSNVTSTPLTSSRKVHFADGSPMIYVPMTESPEGSGGDKEHDGNPLAVHPSGIINFVNEGGELVSTLDLQNTDPATTLSFKLKTTSPEKFRVRPSVGCLKPGARATVQVTLLPGFQLGGLSRDKFLLMSTVIDSAEMMQDLGAIWKDTSGRKVQQHRLKCAQTGELARNGSAVALSPFQDEQNQSQKLVANINKLTECQQQMHSSVKLLQIYQIVTMILVVVLGCLVAFIWFEQKGNADSAGYCSNVAKNP